MSNLSTHPPERQEEYRSSGAWPDHTLAMRVAELAAEQPDNIAVIDGTDGRRVSYAELHTDAKSVAGWMAERGVTAGTGVSVQLPNRYETVVVDLAALTLGARLNPLLPNYRKKELQHILDASDASLLVVPDRYRGFDHVDLGDQLLESVATLDTLLVVGDAAGRHATIDSALACDPYEGGAHSSAADISEIIFTSGTESAPKAVMHSEETLNHSAAAAAAHVGLQRDDVVWMPSPIGHSTGLNFGVRLALLHGLPCVLQDKWDPHHAAQLIETHHASYTLAATTFLSDLLDAGEHHDLTSLRNFGCGGAPVPIELVQRAAESGVRVQRLYGSTEGLIVSWTSPDTDPAASGTHDGEVLADVDVKIWDEAAGAEAPTGSPGEIIVRGPNVCHGFFRDPERTQQTFSDDGWLRTGDLGTLDEHGRLSIVGRKKEIIIRGGLNIAPREIEDLIALHPDISDVAVVGVPDDRLGEIMCACIVTNSPEPPSLDELVDFLTGHGLAKYKLPQRLAPVTSLPRTPTGKLQKFEIMSSIQGATP